MANLITIARVVLLFVTIGFIYMSLPQGDAEGAPLWAVVAAVLTLVVFVSDAFDGMVARARGEANAAGAVFDIAGDRVVENAYWVVFAHIGVLPVWFALIMLARSFLVDGLRSLALTEGKTPFGANTMMTSRFGAWIASSRLHRALFGAAKVVTFIWLCLYLAVDVQVRQDPTWATQFPNAPELMRVAGVTLATFTLLYSLLRGAVVVWDSRRMLGLRTEGRIIYDEHKRGHNVKESKPEPEMDPALITNHSVLSPQSSVLSVFAVFDVDRTLIPVTTTERIFIRYLLRKRVLGVRSVFQTMLFIARNLRKTSPFEAIRRERAYLYGLRYDRIAHMAHDCFETDIKPRISRAGLAAIEEHKRQGHEIVLLSGSLDFLLKPFKEYVGADHLISANMEVAGGKLTGRIVGQYPYGGLKATLMQHFASEHGLDFTRSFAYADHHSDHEVLRLFGNPVVINPKKRMREIAEKEGWEVRSFS